MKLNELAIIGVAATTIVSCTPAKTEYASYELYPVRSGSLTEMEYTPAATQFIFAEAGNHVEATGQFL